MYLAGDCQRGRGAAARVDSGTRRSGRCRRDPLCPLEGRQQDMQLAEIGPRRAADGGRATRGGGSLTPSPASLKRDPTASARYGVFLSAPPSCY